MTHQIYMDELNKKTKKVKIYWLLLIVTISVAIISLLVIIRKETDFFVDVQETKRGLTDEQKMEIQSRLLAGWAQRDLALEEKEEFERQVLGDHTDSLSAEEKLNIEKRLIQ